MWAALTWANPGAAGTMGACVQALDDTGAAFEDGTEAGDPLACHLVTTNEEGEITFISATTWSSAEWAQGNVTKTPMNPGTVIPGHQVDGSAVGYGEAIGEKAAATTETEEVEVDVDVEIEADDMDLQGDDDGWEEPIDDEDMNVDEEGNTEADGSDAANAAAAQAAAIASATAKEEEKAYVEPVVPKTAIPNSIVFHWFQPAFAESYSGLRRYGAGNMV